MSSRKPGYLIGVILLALVLSAPQLFVGFQIGVEAYQSRRWPMPSIPGLGGTLRTGNMLTYATFCQDRFVFDVPSYVNGVYDHRVMAIDPETGKGTDLGWDMRNHGAFELMAFGDRLWLVGSVESFEVVDGALRPSTFVASRSRPQEGQRFLLNGEAAYVVKAIQGFTVSTFKAGTWGNAGDVVLPSSDRVWKLGENYFLFRQAVRIEFRNQGDRVHVFLEVDGLLLHREGFELQPVSTTPGSPWNLNIPGSGSTDEPVSALKVANTDGELAGWSLVRPGALRPVEFGPWHGLFVEGQPAALIVDEVHTGSPIGRIYRFDGAQWSEFATKAFPFGSNQFRAVSCRDGQKSYIVVTTSTGVAHIYAVESSGVRATKGAEACQGNLLEIAFGWHGWFMRPVGMLVLGIILGVGTWCLMWWYTKPDYGFGVQTVRLASLGRRGLARLIDLGLIVLTTVGLGWSMMRGFDWLTLFEALNLHVDHPTKHVAARIATILAAWLAASILTLLFVQARWGVTPGKWLCGLRTLRTTLKPCGFARSLVREVVLAVDACHFLCWAPGIVCIAFTDCRQRLGDLVADTLVVEARSLASQMKTDDS